MDRHIKKYVKATKMASKVLIVIIIAKKIEEKKKTKYNGYLCQFVCVIGNGKMVDDVTTRTTEEGKTRQDEEMKINDETISVVNIYNKSLKSLCTKINKKYI